MKTFKGLYTITKVNENGTIKLKTKHAKHDQLVNQNQLVKYKQAESEPKMESQKETEPINDSEKVNVEHSAKRAYIKILYPVREDDGPMTRSKKIKCWKCK